MTAAAGTRRRFVLTTWDSWIGAAVRPVGVLAVDHGAPDHAVAWVPGSFDDAAGWRDRLADTRRDQLAAAVTGWLEQDTGLHLIEIDPGPTRVDLRTAAEFALDEVLAVLLPMFDEGH